MRTQSRPMARSRAACMARVACLLLCLAVCLAAAPQQERARAAAVAYAGWAVEAYPEHTTGEMEAMVQRMVDAGANVVWIGHNNPGEVEPDKAEPGLSYAVYEAVRDPADPRHEAAEAVVRAQQRMLAACRSVGVQAVLPVGYQIQMGRRWNADHPADLRTDAERRPLDIYGGGVSASFYAPSYRHDIGAYYRWIEDEFVQPYRDVVLMLNLADEPIGGDYSAHAEAEFRARHGFGFADVGNDVERQRRLGEFQSQYVVEYAAFSARLWQQIHPGLAVTMSFDGSQARATLAMPDVEGLFRDTPANLVVTVDAYPHDGLPDVAAGDQEMVGLYLLARSVGLYSARYGKPVWLWAAANSWGLSQAAPDRGTVSDAVANGLSLALLVRQGGGDLQGIAFWNYNVKGQGLYNDTHQAAYNPEVMFSRVSAALPDIRRLMSAPAGRPAVLILSPSAVAGERIGRAREAVRLQGMPYQELAVLARTGVNAAVVGGLGGWSLDGVTAIVVLASPAGAADRDILAGFLAQGGTVVGPAGLDAALAPAAPAVDRLFDGPAERRGTLYTARGELAALAAAGTPAARAFWEEVLGLAAIQPGYRIVTDEVAFYYNLGPEPAAARLLLPFEAIGFRYDAQGRPAGRIHGPYATIELGRREYILLRRVPWLRPWFM